MGRGLEALTETLRGPRYVQERMEVARREGQRLEHWQLAQVQVLGPT